jgi:hypothetical protein
MTASERTPKIRSDRIERLIRRESRTRRVLRLMLCLGSFIGAVVFLSNAHGLPRITASSSDGGVLILSALGAVALWFGTAWPAARGLTVSESFLGVAKLRPLALAVSLLSFSGVAYVITRPAMGPSGESPLGYSLGIIASGIMLWLVLYRWRKEDYFARGLTLRSWLALHVYLGLALLLLVPLHAGFEMDWNVHGAAFMLTVGAILTGLVGVFIYVRVPRLMTINRRDSTLPEMLEQVAALDGDLIQHLARLPDDIVSVARDAIEKTEIGGTLIVRAFGVSSSLRVLRALDELARMSTAASASPEEQADIHRLVDALIGKARLLEQIDQDLQYEAWLEVWLLAHIPLAFGALIAVAIHVFVVLYF